MFRTRKARLRKTGIPGVRITIGDTGHGIPKDILPRVFEPFYTTKGINGTGLGLWISLGIVQKHHGRLQVRSGTEENRSGTVFSLFLPSDPKKVERNRISFFASNPGSSITGYSRRRQEVIYGLTISNRSTSTNPKSVIFK